MVSIAHARLGGHGFNISFTHFLSQDTLLLKFVPYRSSQRILRSSPILQYFQTLILYYPKSEPQNFPVNELLHFMGLVQPTPVYSLFGSVWTRSLSLSANYPPGLQLGFSPPKLFGFVHMETKLQFPALERFMDKGKASSRA